MQWLELSVSATSDIVETVAAIMGKYGQGGAAIEQTVSTTAADELYTVKIYVPHTRAFRALEKEIAADLAPLPVQLEERMLRPADWFASLKAHFHTLEIGEKLVIKPGWEKFLASSSRAVIELDPGAAFGTGSHPTTRLCLLRLEKHLKPGLSVLDLGTGTGILAIAAAKLGAASILALDIDPIAIKVAKDNSSMNAVSHLIQFRRGSLSLRVQREFRKRFDLVVANITAAAISGLAQGLHRVIRNGGIFIGTGIHANQLDEVLINLALAGFQLEAIDSDEEWRAVVAIKPILQS